MAAGGSEGDIESIHITRESMAMPQMNVNYLKSVLQSIHLSADKVSQQFRDLKWEPSLQVPMKTLFLSGLYVLQKMCTPSSMSWPSSWTEMQDVLCDVMSHVTAEFICELLRSCSSSAEECHLLNNELSLVLSSVTSASKTTTTVPPTRKGSHDDFHCAGLKEDCDLIDQHATNYSSSEPEFTVCQDVKLETLDTCIDKSNRPFMRQHFYEFTKNVPPALAFCRRGVRCKICFYLYKGPTCVDSLVEHTKARHPHRASPKHLNQLRENNTIQKIVGDGMRICKCQMCSYIGAGSLLT